MGMRKWYSDRRKALDKSIRSEDGRRLTWLAISVAVAWAFRQQLAGWPLAVVLLALAFADQTRRLGDSLSEWAEMQFEGLGVKAQAKRAKRHFQAAVVKSAEVEPAVEAADLPPEEEDFVQDRLPAEDDDEQLIDEV